MRSIRVIDLETTGLHADDEVVEVGAIDLNCDSGEISIVDVSDVARLAMAGLVQTPTAATKAVSPAAATLANPLE
jgi:DNA polymerase III epsilon subunit-like protein